MTIFMRQYGKAYSKLWTDPPLIGKGRKKNNSLWTMASLSLSWSTISILFERARQNEAELKRIKRIQNRYQKDMSQAKNKNKS